MTMNPLNISYEKRKNSELFKSFQDEDLTNLSNIQNYVPIYNKFFSLNETNYNSINLNHEWYVTKVLKQVDYNTYKCELKHNKTEKTKAKNIFFKMAPLLDPFKMIIGKYDVKNTTTLYNLPKIDLNVPEIHEKILDQNNSAYVDSLFSFFSSQLNKSYHFVHGIDFYGSFLAIKNNFVFNIIDDLDFISRSDYFNKNKNVLFKVEDYSFLLKDDNKKPPIIIVDQDVNPLSLSLKSIHNDLFDDIFEDDKENETMTENNHISLDNLKEFSIELSDIQSSFKNNELDNDITKISTIKSNSSSGSSCSSRTSHTSNDEVMETVSSASSSKENIKTFNESSSENESCEDEVDEDDDEEEDEDEEDEEERIDVTLEKFPVQIICMENCENTLDELILNDELNENEWFSALMQIIMTLVTYQKAFSFTHNDLHTNNIMYNTTDKKYLYYCYNKTYYKVPTYGKVYKIIDFGRGIYKYGNKQFCSDCFKNGEDAATQYNIEPYFNNKKPRLEPNYSFDLCRLACSIFDYIIEDMSEISDLDECSPLVRLIVEWCLDDNGVNILYKNNGQERYPDFKLYKMIARCVHNHTPQAQLERKEFNKYVVETVSKNENVINIDEIPCFYEK
jgi:hypothetical protein